MHKNLKVHRKNFLKKFLNTFFLYKLSLPFLYFELTKVKVLNIFCPSWLKVCQTFGYPYIFQFVCVYFWILSVDLAESIARFNNSIFM